MPILTTAHYTAFGAIIHGYASTEFGIKAALGGILEIPLAEAMIIAEPYTASTLENVAKSLAKESMLSKANQERFVQIVGDWSAFGALRNHIAHFRWQRGNGKTRCARLTSIFALERQSGSQLKRAGIGRSKNLRTKWAKFPP